MNLQETRQLGIEFERRVQVMIPETEFLQKLDTDTIYSFLNQYLDKYIHEIYSNLNDIPSGTSLQARIEKILQSMLRSATLNGNSQNNVYSAQLAALPDFGMYIRSVSNVSSSYKKMPTNVSSDSANGGDGILPNQLVSQPDAQRFIETPNNNLRIMRIPIAYLDTQGNIKVIHDRYTTITNLTVTYYKTPQYFNILTDTPCELPIDCFDDLVSGAVDLYVQYVAGAEARKRLLQEQQKQLLNAQQNNKNQEEQ